MEPRKSNPSNWAALVSAYLTVLLVVFAISCGKEKQKVTEEVARLAKIMTIVPTEMDIVHRYPGTVRASKRVDLALLIASRLF